VYFATGSITGATDSTHLDVGRRLVAEVDPDEAALEAVVEAALCEPAGGLAKALIAAGSVEPAVVERAVTDHVADVVGELLRWTDGSFIFALDEANPDDVEVKLGVDDVVTRAQECLDRWNALGSRAPSQDAVLALSMNPATQAVVSADEWKVLAHVDGQRPVREIVRLTEWGEYRVAEALTALVERGLLVSKEQRDAELLVLERRQKLLQRLDPDVQPSAPATAPIAAEPDPEPQRVEEPVEESVEEPVEEPVSPDLLAEMSAAFQAVSQEPEPEPEAEPIPAPTEEPKDYDGDTNVNKSLLLRLIAGVQGL
jgi:hypothetical protein